VEITVYAGITVNIHDSLIYKPGDCHDKISKIDNASYAMLLLQSIYFCMRRLEISKDLYFLLEILRKERNENILSYI